MNANLNKKRENSTQQLFAFGTAVDGAQSHRCVARRGRFDLLKSFAGVYREKDAAFSASDAKAILASTYFLSPQRLCARRRGQALTEYAVLIAVLVGIILALGAGMMNTLKPMLEERINRYSTEMFQGEGVHKFYFSM